MCVCVCVWCVVGVCVWVVCGVCVWVVCVCGVCGVCVGGVCVCVWSQVHSMTQATALHSVALHGHNIILHSQHNIELCRVKCKYCLV